jgi:hypothetical protein
MFESSMLWIGVVNLDAQELRAQIHNIAQECERG